MSSEGMINTRRKIRILFIIDYLHLFAGTEKHLYQLIHGLTKARFKCYLVALDYSEESLAKFKQAGVECPCYSLNRFYSLKTPAFLLTLKKYVLAERIDFIQTYNAVSDLVGAILSKWTRSPIHIVNLRDMGGYRRRRYNLILKFVKRRRKAYIAVCEAVADFFRPSLDFPKRDFEVIYNGINVPKHQGRSKSYFKWVQKKYRLPENAYIIGNVSQFRAEKGYDVYFEAIRLLGEKIPDLVAFAIGDGPFLEFFKKKFQNGPLSSRLIFTGYLNNFVPELSCFDVFCITPSSNEGFSNAILEAMAFGKPVIATDVGGNKEAVVHGKTGYIVPTESPEEIAERLFDLYYSPAKRKIMGEQGKLRIRESFSLMEIVSKYEKYYQEKWSREILP